MTTIFASIQIIFYFAATVAILKIGYDLSCLLKTLNKKIGYETKQRELWDKQEELANSSTLQDIYHG